jgi:hypothetical protein
MLFWAKLVIFDSYQSKCMAGAMTLSITALSIATLSIMTMSITTFSIIINKM